MNNMLNVLFLVSDFRFVIIKLAERITYLRDIKDSNIHEQIFAAKECFNLYVPLANRLGIKELKWELEDFCFRYLYPDEYKKISILIHEKRIDREKYINNFIIILRNYIIKKNIQVEIYGRPKHIYSIWKKMKKKSLSFNKIFDLHAIRVVVDCLQDCYIVLDILHKNFIYFPNEFDDYIINPKPNGYQSIHTVIIGPKYKVLEIQIRTKQMHKNAELGIAAHWKYKEIDGVNNKKNNIYNYNNKYINKFVFFKKNINLISI